MTWLALGATLRHRPTMVSPAPATFTRATPYFCGGVAILPAGAMGSPTPTGPAVKAWAMPLSTTGTSALRPAILSPTFLSAGVWTKPIVLLWHTFSATLYTLGWPSPSSWMPTTSPADRFSPAKK